MMSQRCSIGFRLGGVNVIDPFILQEPVLMGTGFTVRVDVFGPISSFIWSKFNNNPSATNPIYSFRVPTGRKNK